MVDRLPVTGEILRGSLLEPASHHADVHALHLIPASGASYEKELKGL